MNRVAVALLVALLLSIGTAVIAGGMFAASDHGPVVEPHPRPQHAPTP